MDEWWSALHSTLPSRAKCTGNRRHGWPLFPGDPGEALLYQRRHRRIECPQHIRLEDSVGNGQVRILWMFHHAEDGKAPGKNNGASCIEFPQRKNFESFHRVVWRTTHIEHLKV